ncbi:hypothetical protein [Mycobacterium sp.]|nr:hypothetical protein [Mycobacterium sp.]
MFAVFVVSADDGGVLGAGALKVQLSADELGRLSDLSKQFTS